MKYINILLKFSVSLSINTNTERPIGMINNIIYCARTGISSKVT
ncbi:hypothetical protein [Niallia circulans]